jgi:hypothetical protein
VPALRPRERCVNPFELETRGREVGVYFTADDLMTATFPEPRWAVQGLVAEGLNLLVGSPKFGKSCVCLGLGVARASGGRALSKVERNVFVLDDAHECGR